MKRKLAFFNRYDEIFADLNLKKPQSYWMPFYFIIRRIVVAFGLVNFGAYPLFQMCILLLTSYFIVIKNLAYHPYQGNAQNKIEIINEFCILFLAYLSLSFSDFNPEPKLRNKIGSFYCLIILLVILVNALFIAKMTYLDMKKSYFKKKIQRKSKVKKGSNDDLLRSRASMPDTF